MQMTVLLPAALILCAAGGGAYWCAARKRPNLALAVLGLAPLLAVVPFVVAGSGAGSGAAPEQGAPPPVATGPAESATSAARPAGSATSVAPMTGARPTGVMAEREREAAEQLRVDGKYAEARDAFRRLAARMPQDADAWADAADCAAAAAAGNLDAGAADIEHALGAQPTHPKALWLKASLELQHKRYGAAAALWERLLAVLPADSEDRRTVQANLDEARALAAKPAARG